jgi:hypothetical protein
VGQILLYGSVGTASSAVVYFLQEQIRQVQRLKHLLESKKRFADALRKHGISEATIQRMRKATLEDHIQELERRGLVRLELVDEPPKWTSSPHKGQMYHIEYLPSKSQPRRIIEYVTQTVGDQDTEIPTEIGQQDRFNHWWKDMTVPITSALRRQGREIFMRKHWVDRIGDWGNNKNTFYHSWPAGKWCTRSVLHSFNSRTHLQSTQPASIAWYTQAAGRNPEEMVIVPEITEKALDTLTYDHHLQKISVELFQKWDSHQGSTFGKAIDAMTITKKVLTLLSVAPATSQMFKDASAVINYSLDTGIMRAEDALSTLLLHHAYTQVMALYDNLSQNHKHPQSSSVVLHTLAKLSDTTQPWFVKKHTIDMLDFILRDCTTFHLESVFGILDSRQQLTPLLLDKIFAQAVLGQAEPLHKVMIALGQTSFQNELGAFILHAVEQNAHSISPDGFIHISTTVDAVFSGNSTNIHAKLFEYALQAQQVSSAVTIFENHSHIMPSKEKSGIPLLVHQAYSLLSEVGVMRMDPRKVLSYFKRCEIQIRDSFLPSIVKRYCIEKSIPTLLRAEYLREASSVLSADRATALLLALPVDVDRGFGAIVQDLRIDALARLAGRAGSDDDVYKTYIAIQKSLSGSGESLLPLRKAMMHSSLAAGRKDLSAIVAKDLYAEHNEIHSSWEQMLEIMIAMANSGRSEECLDILQTLNKGRFIPSRKEQRLRFCAVYFYLAVRVTPKQWLNFAEECSSKYGLEFGPKAYDKVVEQAIFLYKVEECRDILYRLMKLSSSQTFDVGVRQRTISKAILSLVKREDEAERSTEGAFIYWLFKKVCKVNERLVSQDLADQIIDLLGKSDKDDKTVMQTFPRTFGQRWTKNHYDRYRASKLELRKQTLNAVLSRVPVTNILAESLGVFQETSRSFLDHEIKSKRELLQAAKESKRAVQSGKFRQVVEKFAERLSSGQVIDKELLYWAVVACTRLHDLRTATEFCDRVGEKGVDTMLARLKILEDDLLNNTAMTQTKIRALVLDWYAKSASTHPHLAHRALRTATIRLTGNHGRRLERRGNNHRTSLNAIKLMLEILNSEWAEKVPFGIQEYTALLTAYHHARNFNGVNWTVATVLKNNLPISVSFMNVLTRESNDLVSELAHKQQHAATRKAHAFWRNLKNICNRRRIAQRESVHKAHTTIMNVLLYDAVHPDVDDLVHITARRMPGVLDTKVTSLNRENSLGAINLAKMHRSEAIRLTQEESTRRWQSIHSDSSDHHNARKELDSGPLDVLKAMEVLGANKHRSGKRIYDDNLQSDTASLGSVGYDAIPWTELDTQMLDLLKVAVSAENNKTQPVSALDRLEGLSRQPNSEPEPRSLEDIVKEIKRQPEFNFIRNTDTALEQMIRNKDKQPGTLGVGETIWKDVMKRNKQVTWTHSS